MFLGRLWNYNVEKITATVKIYNTHSFILQEMKMRKYFLRSSGMKLLIYFRGFIIYKFNIIVSCWIVQLGWIVLWMNIACTPLCSCFQAIFNFLYVLVCCVQKYMNMYAVCTTQFRYTIRMYIYCVCSLANFRLCIKTACKRTYKC